MRKIASFVVVFAAVLAQRSMAQASTEVLHFPANNRMVIATATLADGTNLQIGVSRELTGPGGPVDQIGIIIISPDGNVTFARGTLPAGAFHYDATSASLDVDVADITFEDPVIGDLPESGIISIDWEGTDVTRTAGSNVQDQGNLTIIFSGVRTEVVADITGTLFGAPLVAPTGFLQALSQQVTVIMKN